MYRTLAALLGLGLAVTSLGGQDFPSGTFAGKVLSVTDGDTFEMEIAATGQKVAVRVYGMDAPESDQAFGKTARERLEKLVLGQSVTVTRKGISYNRVVGDTYLGTTRVSAVMIGQGMALWYRQFAPNDDDLNYAEADARDDNRGIWKWSANPVAPWEWRRIMRTVRLEEKRKAENP